MFEELKKISTAAFRGRSIPVAILLILVVLLSAGSGLYAGASFFAQQAPNVTVTTTIFTTTTSWTTSTIWSTVTSVIQGVWTTVEYTTSTSTVTITGGDTYTKLLLHMDGTGGSKAFLDSSPQPHTITANGNAQIDTAQSKFGGASGLFHGTGDYLSVPDSADWYFGTGDFTIDFWVRFNALPAVNTWSMFANQYADGTHRWFLALECRAGPLYLYRIFVQDGGVLVDISTANTGVAVNTWYHVALVRSGSSWYVFQGGTQVGATATDADGVPDVAASLLIGGYGTGQHCLNGWLDEFRLSKGVARWTSNFTPPTAPY